MRERFPVIVRGGGDLATGTIYQLHQAGFPVLVLETETPSAIRRYVAFSEAIYEGTWCVEGVTAQKITHWQEAREVLAAGNIPVLSDPRLNILSQLSPHVLIDAILAKRNLGTSIHMADTVIALGPGFSAGKDAHFVIETQRGHHLGRVITEGSAAPDTGVPGIIAGLAKSGSSMLRQKVFCGTTVRLEIWCEKDRSLRRLDKRLSQQPWMAYYAVCCGKDILCRKVLRSRISIHEKTSKKIAIQFPIKRAVLQVVFYLAY